MIRPPLSSLPKGAEFEIDMHATADTVRNMLSDLRRTIEECGIGPQACGAIEIAVAEALNNIVEHAYAPSGAGPLHLRATLAGDRLEIELRDNGHPLPGLKMPRTPPPETSGPLSSMPEGGFGWHLIHNLTDKLSYRRQGGENQLRLGFTISARPH